MERVEDAVLAIAHPPLLFAAIAASTPWLIAVGVVTRPAELLAEKPSDWPQSRHTSDNQAASVFDSAANAEPRAFTFEGSGRTYGYEPGMTVWTSAALGLVDGRALLFVGSYDHNVYALDAATGSVVYTLTTGGRVQSAPVLFTDPADQSSWLYVGSNDRILYALDAKNGRQRWVHSVEAYRPTLGGARLSSPAVAVIDGRPTVFVGHWVFDRSLASSFQRGRLSAFDARTGRPVWTTDLGDNEITAPVLGTPSGLGPRVFVGSSSGILAAVEPAGGAVIWRHTEMDAIKSAPAVLDVGDRSLVVVSSKYGTVRALDAERGTEVWSFKADDRVMGSPIGIEVEGRLRVVFGAYDGRIYALDAASGRLEWQYAAQAGLYSSPAAALDGRLVLVSAWDHMLHAVWVKDGRRRNLTFTGAPLWAVSGLDSSTWSSPTAARIGGKWMAYVGSYDGMFRAIPLGDEAHDSTPSRSNLRFWVSFPAVLGPVIALAVLLTRRDRRRRANATSAQRATLLR